MLEFSAKEEALLRAVFDTLLPEVASEEVPIRDYWKRKGTDWITPQDIAEGLAGVSPVQQQEFRQLLKLLSSWTVGVTWNGPLKPFIKLNPKQRATLLQAWRDHRVNLFRKAFSTLKKLIIFLFYTKAEKQQNPAWPIIGYPGPLPEAEPPPRDRMEVIYGHQIGDTLSCDVLVIGSGAGGGVVAAELAQAGHDVLVVEKGPYLDRSDFNQLEADMGAMMYEAKGALTTDDGGVTVFAGSCLGGGTTINWAGAFRTPDYILNEWARQHENPGYTSAELGASLEAVAERIGVNTEYPYHNQQNQALLNGSRALGQEPELIPRNEVGLGKEDFKGIGYSCSGDRYGHKQGTVQTYLRDALKAGARILPRTYIDRITHQGGHTTGAVGKTMAKAEWKPLTIKAKKVVVAAGSIYTPVILSKSGLSHKHLGKHLYFHPTVAVSALYPTVTDPAWFGPMMSVVNNHFTKLDGNYGFKLETPPAHVGLCTLALPWMGGVEHKRAMLDLSRLGHFIVLTRDKYGGSVSVDKYGFPRIQYKLSPYDQNHLVRGIQEGARIQLAGGAEEIIFPYSTDRRFVAKEGKEALETALKDLPNWGWKPNQFPLFSAHQMGTARMGGNNARHPVAPNGETREMKGLYVADASLFPAASGVNPMLTIMGLAHYIAQGLK
ncbi:MAG: FAD-dependent oxidoreductase [Bacteroidota bacterium]